VIGETFDRDGDVFPEVKKWMDDLERMVERNDPAVEIINIC
jgi:hypothetical protein